MSELKRCAQGLEILMRYDDGSASITGHSDSVHVNLFGHDEHFALPDEDRQRLAALGWKLEYPYGDDDRCWEFDGMSTEEAQR